MNRIIEITAEVCRELARRTTELAKDVFQSRGMVYPHPADTSLDQNHRDKYEPVIKEHYSREEQRLAREEEMTQQGPRNQPGMGGR